MSLDDASDALPARPRILASAAALLALPTRDESLLAAGAGSSLGP